MSYKDDEFDPRAEEEVDFDGAAGMFEDGFLVEEEELPIDDPIDEELDEEEEDEAY